MALEIGVSSGFVEEAPVADPTGGDFSITNRGRVTKDTSPATAGTITEMGWYASNASQKANFEVGLYAADGDVEPGEAGTLLEVDRTNAKGTTEGWKVVTGLNWSISSSTAYWLGVQLDNTATTTEIDISSSGGFGSDFITLIITLPNPFGGGGVGDSDGMYAVYAVWEAGAAAPTTAINIGDVWKSIAAMKINIGDSWKAVAAAKINIGDAWKVVDIS